MLKFTLMKNLYYELDPDKMPESREVHSGDAHYRTLALSLPEVPAVSSITMQEKYMPYVTLYNLFVNDERYPADIEDPEIKKLLAAFYRHYHPEYLVPDAPRDPDEIDKMDILTLLDPDKMPGYQKKYAYKEILTVEDLRNGKTGDEHKTKTAFPGMSFTDKYRPK